MLLFRVLSAIQFNCEVYLTAVEIQDIRGEWVLAAEFQPQ